jgi:DNA processing protein
MARIKYWMWLACLTALRPKAKLRALEHFGGAEELFFAERTALQTVPGLWESDIKQLADKRMDRAMRALEKCASLGVHILTIEDERYPRRLGQIYDPPAVLFVRGALPEIDSEAAFAVVGTRDCSAYGDKMGEKFGFELARCGGLVVSSLARGVDSAAARGALLAGGRCVGVLGVGIDRAFAANRPLYADICAHGAILSEYPPDTVYNRSHYPARNRILSGLAVGVVIVEAPARSGALITADYAQEQGREVFAVPGNVDAPTSCGSNALLLDGARPVLTGWDAAGGFAGLYPGKLHEFAPEIPAQPAGKEPSQAVSVEKETKKDVDNAGNIDYIDLKAQLDGLTEHQLAIVAAIGSAGSYADELIERTGLPAGTVMGELTMLQLSGLVTPVGFDRYKLNIKMK